MSALNIIKNDQPDEATITPLRNSVKQTKLKEIQAIFERRWLLNPKSFDPMRNCMTAECLERTWSLLMETMDPKQKNAVDIGCGMGILSKRLLESHASHVTALDISENALKQIHFNQSNFKITCEGMPFTKLHDENYEIVICTNLIAEIPQQYHRLFFAELSRIIRSNGHLALSSSIDVNSEGGLDKLKELIQTEFDIQYELPSYHALYIRLKKLLRFPYICTEGWSNPTFKEKELKQRKGFNYLWYWMNTTPLLVGFWYAINPISHFLLNLLKNKRSILLLLEKICHLISDQDGISHVIFIAQRRPLQLVNPNDAIRKPGKKEIWE